MIDYVNLDWLVGHWSGPRARGTTGGLLTGRGTERERGGRWDACRKQCACRTNCRVERGLRMEREREGESVQDDSVEEGAEERGGDEGSNRRLDRNRGPLTTFAVVLPDQGTIPLEIRHRSITVEVWAYLFYSLMPLIRA